MMARATAHIRQLGTRLSFNHGIEGGRHEHFRQQGFRSDHRQRDLLRRRHRIGACGRDGRLNGFFLLPGVQTCYRRLEWAGGIFYRLIQNYGAGFDFRAVSMLTRLSLRWRQGGDKFENRIFPPSKNQHKSLILLVGALGLEPRTR